MYHLLHACYLSLLFILCFLSLSSGLVIPLTPCEANLQCSPFHAKCSFDAHSVCVCKSGYAFNTTTNRCEYCNDSSQNATALMCDRYSLAEVRGSSGYADVWHNTVVRCPPDTSYRAARWNETLLPAQHCQVCQPGAFCHDIGTRSSVMVEDKCRCLCNDGYYGAYCEHAVANSQRLWQARQWKGEDVWGLHYDADRTCGNGLTIDHQMCDVDTELCFSFHRQRPEDDDVKLQSRCYCKPGFVPSNRTRGCVQAPSIVANAHLLRTLPFVDTFTWLRSQWETSVVYGVQSSSVVMVGLTIGGTWSASNDRDVLAFSCATDNEYFATNSTAQGWCGVSASLVCDSIGTHTTATGWCTCRTGFTGAHCETCVPERYGLECNQTRQQCRESQCGSHGDCIHERLSGPVCECDEGYVGSNCSTTLQACSEERCNYPRGRCEKDGETCECFEGGEYYYGSNCQWTREECRSVLCSELGECMSSRYGVCKCDYTAYGQAFNCTQTLCQNKAQLIPGTFQCNCSTVVDEYNRTFTGADCGTVVHCRGLGYDRGAYDLSECSCDMMRVYNTNVNACVDEVLSWFPGDSHPSVIVASAFTAFFHLSLAIKRFVSPFFLSK
jgi:hypothetical protein